jgi:hypothetical protein
VQSGGWNWPIRNCYGGNQPDDLDMKFQQVVRPVRTEEADLPRLFCVLHAADEAGPMVKARTAKVFMAALPNASITARNLSPMTIAVNASAGRWTGPFPGQEKGIVSVAGLPFLRPVSRSWFNLDATWAFSLILVGALSLSIILASRQ